MRNAYFLPTVGKSAAVVLTFAFDIVTGSQYSDCHRYPKAEILYHYYATSEWNRYIRGNEYVPLLEPRQPLAERRIGPLLCNVKAQQTFPK
jgi:hypothetical protein